RRDGRAVAASAQPARGGPHSARVGRTGHRATSVDCDWLGLALVRDDPRARRAAARDGDAALGLGARATDRDRGRAALPARCNRSRAPREPYLRNWGSRPRLLRRLDARIRAAARALALDDSGAGADAAALKPLARPRDAALLPGRPEARRQHLLPDGGARHGGAPRPWGGARFGNRLVDSRTRRVAATPAVAFASIQRLGGQTGWYHGDFLWRLRGWLDLLV